MQPKPAEDVSILHSFDFTAIEEMDPSLGKLFFSPTLIIKTADGHKIIYDREVPFELRIQDTSAAPQEVGTLEAIKVKVLVLVYFFALLLVCPNVNALLTRTKIAGG